MIQTLVSHGHHYHDVMNMDFGDFLAFIKVIHRQKREHYKMLATCVRVAGADKKHWEKWLEID